LQTHHAGLGVCHNLDEAAPGGVCGPRRRREEDVKLNVKVMVLAGAAWAFIGLGLMVMHFGYVPAFSEFIGIAVGLLLAGMLTSALLLRIVALQKTPVGRWSVQLSYLLFAPIGLLTALLAPIPLEGAGLALALLAPFLTALLASVAVMTGMGFVGLTAMGAHQLALRLSPPRVAQVTNR
jgi:branched-subunit amino acid transport protein